MCYEEFFNDIPIVELRKNGPCKQNSWAESSFVCVQTRFSNDAMCFSHILFFYMYVTHTAHVCIHIFLELFYVKHITYVPYGQTNKKNVPFWMKSMICAVLVDDKNEESNSRVICKTHSKIVKGQKLCHAAMLYVSLSICFSFFLLSFIFSLVQQ